MSDFKVNSYDWEEGGMNEYPNSDFGDYVKVDDYKSLKDENDRLSLTITLCQPTEDTIKHYRDSNTKMLFVVEQLTAEIESLKKANKTYQPRIDELEEGCLEQHKQNESLIAEIESLKKDAEAYKDLSEYQKEWESNLDFEKQHLTAEVANLRDALESVKRLTFSNEDHILFIPIYNTCQLALNPKKD